jgi:hypothetical protein
MFSLTVAKKKSIVKWTIRGSNPGRENRLFVLQNVQTGSGFNPPSSSLGFFPKLEGPGRDVHRSPPTSVEVKNE